MSTHNPAIWQGDGLPDYEDWRDFVMAMDMTMPELEGWLDACKSEAWIREKSAKYEHTERNLDVARFFWRRTEKLRKYMKELEAELDAEDEEADDE